MKATVRSIVAAIVLLPAIGHAHTHLVRSVPADNASLDKSPPVATLVFAEPVTLTAIRIESSSGGKTVVKLPSATASAEASVPLAALPVGHFKLSWRAVSEDGHIMSGEIHFSIVAKALR
jgi:methionine-rich copper-binding protein CopC